MKYRFRTPSPALVISLLALFVALGGTSYAAIHLPRNSVGAKQLRKNAVRTKKIQNGAVGAGKIKKNAIRTNKIKDGAVTAAKINTTGLTVPDATHATTANSATHATSADSATHATSADSATNATHATSADSATNATHATSADSATNATNSTNATNATTAGQLTSITYVVGSSTSVPAGSAAFAFVACPAGTFPVGGGEDGVTADTLYLDASFASTSGGSFGHAGWGVRMFNTGSSAASFTPDVVCAAAAGTS